MLRGGSLLSVAAQNTGTDYETVEIEQGESGGHGQRCWQHLGLPEGPISSLVAAGRLPRCWSRREMRLAQAGGALG